MFRKKNLSYSFKIFIAILLCLSFLNTLYCDFELQNGRRRRHTPHRHFHPRPPITVEYPKNISIRSRDSGMFSLFFDVLYASWEWDNGLLDSFTVDFHKQGLYFEEKYGDNWWEYYCEPIRLGSPTGEVRLVEYGSYKHRAPWAEWIGSGIPRKNAYDLVEKYIHPKQHIIEKVDSFYNEHLLGKHVIAIHYRGTDKISEAPRADYKNISDQVEQSIRKLEKYKNIKIFIATDEQDFIDYATSLWGDRICYRDAIRSTDKRPVHTNKANSPYQLGEDAMIDMLLLSRSDLLIRTSSNLSLWSTFFNPYMGLIEITKRYWQ
jgi:hypothetical protein